MNAGAECASATTGDVRESDWQLTKLAGFVRPWEKKCGWRIHRRSSMAGVFLITMFSLVRVSIELLPAVLSQIERNIFFISWEIKRSAILINKCCLITGWGWGCLHLWPRCVTSSRPPDTPLNPPDPYPRPFSHPNVSVCVRVLVLYCVNPLYGLNHTCGRGHKYITCFFFSPV